MRNISVLLGAAALAACASSQQRAFVAPTSQTVTTTTEEGRGTTPSQTIYVENHSTVGITVYSFTLRGCENVKQSCDPHTLNLKVPPGARRLLARVEPKMSNQGFGYRFSYGWRADSATSTAALAAIAQGGDGAAQQRLAAIQQAEAERAQEPAGSQDEELGTADYAKLGSRLVKLRVEPESLVVHVGQSFSLRRQVRVLAIGPNGETLGRARALRWRVWSQAVTLTLPDTVVARIPGRAVVEFMLPASEAGVTVPTVPAAELPIVVQP